MAGLPCARREDLVLGMCYNEEHDPIQFVGLILGGASISKMNNLDMAQETNVVIGFCGHVGIITTSSLLSKVENLGMARQFDLVIGENLIANVMTGSGNVNTG